MGRIVPRAGQSQLATNFNEFFRGVFDFASGNMLQFGNILSWNIWLESPEYVDQTEWQTHAERWRDSFNNDEHHGVDDEADEERAFKYYDGTSANPLTNVLYVATLLDTIANFISDNFSVLQVNSQVNRMIMDESFSEIDKEEVKDTLRRHRLL